MKLNCRPGDRAVVIKTLTGKQIGKIVECVRIIGNVHFAHGLMAPAWETNPPLVGTDGMRTVCPDPWLSPNPRPTRRRRDIDMGTSAA